MKTTKTLTITISALAITFILVIQTGVAEARTNPLRASIYYQKMSQRLKGWAKLRAPQVKQIRSMLRTRWAGAMASASRSLAKAKDRVWPRRRNSLWNRPNYLLVRYEIDNGTITGPIYQREREPMSQFQLRARREMDAFVKKITDQGGHARAVVLRYSSY